MTESIRILICDDHPIVREGLRSLIETDASMELVGEALDGVEAVELAIALRPDVILIDLVMPRQNGIEAIAAIKQQMPLARILVLTSFTEDEKVFAAIRAGASGYLLKDALPRELLQAIRDVHRGQSSLHPLIASKVLHELSRPSHPPLANEPLTDRELDVLRLVALGATTDEIADKLCISPRTVRTHVSNILGKLHLANRTQLALYARDEGITGPATNDEGG